MVEAFTELEFIHNLSVRSAVTDNHDRLFIILMRLSYPLIMIRDHIITASYNKF